MFALISSNDLFCFVNDRVKEKDHSKSKTEKRKEMQKKEDSDRDGKVLPEPGISFISFTIHRVAVKVITSMRGSRVSSVFCLLSNFLLSFFLLPNIYILLI